MYLNDLNLICNDDIVLLAYLQSVGLIKTEEICKKCKVEKSIVKCEYKFMFQCKKCRVKSSVSKRGSCMYKTRVGYDIILQIFLFFLNDVKVSSVIGILGISKDTVIGWYNYCRQICLYDVITTERKIGGDGVVVEIDESAFGKRKNRKGKFVKPTWVVGGVERESKKCFLKIVNSRDEKTLIRIIQENVEEKSIIITDEWKGYKGLRNKNYIHQTVNHSKGFKNYETGETTNKIEGTWVEVKRTT